MQTSATPWSSDRSNTRPMGLLGVFSTTARVRGVTSASSASRSSRYPGASSVRNTGLAAERTASGP